MFERQARINQVLEHYLPSPILEPCLLHQAMRYVVLNGGKRLRPLLVYAAGETLGAKLEQLGPAACAVELIHAYSLVHDDLPAMDNDDFRRGQPSCHKAFNEATAILVGDALQALAFQLLTDEEGTFLPSSQRLQMAKVLTQACGSKGMVGGQAMEFTRLNETITIEELDNIHRLKTGALIRASVQLGAFAAQANSRQLQALDNYASCLGLAFQIQDDLLDYTSDQVTFSYLNVMSIENTKEKVSSLYHEALRQIADFGNQAQPLHWLADYMIQPVYR